MQAETRTQIARIEADGGTIIDANWMDLTIKTMKDQGIYSDCKFLGDANFGVKKDSGTGAVSVLYDISGNDNDAVQTVGLAQPIWTAEQQNGKAGIIFDGSDDQLTTINNLAISGSDTKSIFTANKSAVVNFTITGFLYTTGITTANKSLLLGVRDTDVWYLSDSAVARYTGVANTISFMSSSTHLNDSTQLTVYINNIVTDINLSSSAQDITLAPLIIGSAWSEKYYNGNISSLFALNIDTTTTQRQAIEALINNYYAIY